MQNTPRSRTRIRDVMQAEVHLSSVVGHHQRGQNGPRFLPISCQLLLSRLLLAGRQVNLFEYSKSGSSYPRIISSSAKKVYENI